MNNTANWQPMIIVSLICIGLLALALYRFWPSEVAVFPVFISGYGGGGGVFWVGPAKAIMAMLVSLVVLFAALYVILSKSYESDTQKWAYGVIGLVVGFWLRHEKT